MGDPGKHGLSAKQFFPGISIKGQVILMNESSTKSIAVINRFHADNTIPKGNWVWVFGSNEGGRHGKGAAKVAHVSFGAKYGTGRGITGRSYAIPTKDKHLGVLPFDVVSKNIQEFLDFAKASPRLAFYITRVGCGLAGFADEDIGPLFSGAPMNCCLPEEWKGFALKVANPAPALLRA